MSEFISGKEALIALANGEEVEWRHPERDWFKAPQCNMRTQDFFSGVYQFRIKPCTVTINGIEVPSVKYVAHSGGNCVKISCECPEDAAAIGAALRSVFGKK